VRPLVPLRACLDALAAPEALTDFLSTATGQRGTVRLQCFLEPALSVAEWGVGRPRAGDQDDAPGDVSAVPAAPYAAVWRQPRLDPEKA
jgi:hypothetical protein